MAPPSPKSTDVPNGVPQDKSETTIYPVPSYSQGEVQDGSGSKSPEEATDDAAKYLTDTRAEQFQPLTPEREKRLRKKIDSWMIPLLLFTATLGAVDKVEIGTASLYGFQKDNNMHGQQYSWLGSILPLGQLCGYVVTTWPKAL